MHRSLVAVMMLFLLLPASAFSQAGDTTLEFKNGRWFNGSGFDRRTFYSVGGVLTTKRPRRIDRTVNLAAGFVIPPFGDAHTHNFDGLFNLEKLVDAYIKEGTFYVQVLGNSSAGATEARLQLNKPNTPDVVFANGMLTSTYGHPFMVYEPLAMGIFNPSDAFRRIDEVKKSRRALGQSYWFLDTIADVDAQWPLILRSDPDVIKIALLNARDKKPRAAGDEVNGGLSPNVAGYVVRKARSAGLRVFAHVETADDLRLGIEIGVDGFAHLPNYGWDGREPLEDVITYDDLKRVASANAVVIPTFARARFSYTDFKPDGTATIDEKRRSSVIERHRKIAELMRKAGVRIALGLDIFGSLMFEEIEYISNNRLMSPRELLKILTESTPRSIFPNRKIGRLKDGYEASFLVLGIDPLSRPVPAFRNIKMRYKQGMAIE